MFEYVIVVAFSTLISGVLLYLMTRLAMRWRRVPFYYFLDHKELRQTGQFTISPNSELTSTVLKPGLAFMSSASVSVATIVVGMLPVPLIADSTIEFYASGSLQVDELKDDQKISA